MRQRAARLDRDAAFPAEDVAALAASGALDVPLPAERLGGAEDDRRCADALAHLLMQTGEGNPAVGRVFEAHVNARHLIARYGSAGLRDRTASEVRAGHLFALWVTDTPDDPLRLDAAAGGLRLRGGKSFCSAAGFATRAVVTVKAPDGGSRMAVVALGGGERVRSLPSPLAGMRAAATGAGGLHRLHAGTGDAAGRCGRLPAGA
ncbi:MAG: acyl-CoA dehydrogenase family protein [Acetobacteraceae bacterium]